MPNETIVTFAKAVISRGFDGEIGFHYYCEPTLDIDRMKAIMEQLPDAKFVLWTNGLLLHKMDPEYFKKFNRVLVSLYKPCHIPELQNITISPAPHDDRRSIYDTKLTNPGGCIRPSKTEMCINCYGNLRMCCSDFRGKVMLGNIMYEDHQFLLDGWEEMAIKVAEGKVPLCWQCRAIHSPAIEA
jgi:hypothetical protein